MKAKMQMFATMLALAVLASVALAQTADTTPPPPSHQMRGHWMAKREMFPLFSRELNLTDAQRAQIKQIHESAKSTLQPLWQQERQSHQEMMQLVMSGSFDQAKAQAIANQESQIHSQLAVQRALMASQAYQVLSADQKTKLNEIMAKHQQRMQERRQNREMSPDQAPNQ